MTTRSTPQEHVPSDPADPPTTASVEIDTSGSGTVTPLTAPDGVAFSGRPSAPSRIRVGLVGGAAIALVVGVVATSLAASPASSGSNGGSFPSLITPGLGFDEAVDGFEHGRFGGIGFRNVTITAISGSDVTLGTDDGWRRAITITDAVDVTKGGQAAGLADLKVGDQVAFRQTRNDDGTYTVTAVAIVVPTVRGEVSDLTTSGFKVTTRDGAVWTIAINATTTYAFGVGDGTLADVTNGEPVIVAGTSTDDNALTALSVRVKGDHAAGTVTAKTAHTITIKQRDGSSLTVHVDAGTTYRVRGAATETDNLADVTVDMAIGVGGRSRADGSIDADAVVAGVGRGLFRDGGDGRGGFPGRGWFFGPDGSNDEATPSTAPTTS